MPTCCSVYDCSIRSSGLSFPKDAALRKKWLFAIRRDKWQPEVSSRVCHTHFKETDYKNNYSYHGMKRQRKILKANVVPSQFKWTSKPSPIVKARAERAKARAERSMQEPDIEDIGHDEECVVEEEPAEVMEDMVPNLTPKDTGTQTPNQPILDIKDLMFKPDVIHYYTGLTDYERFCCVLSTLGTAANHLKYRWGATPSMSIENQFLVTLIKLRRHTPNFELGVLFSCSEKVISNIFVTWVNFMYRQWRRVNIWPTRDLTSYFMPRDFQRKFPSTRVILDGTEFPIKKPGKPTAQQVTYSSYKNRNTIKTILGITPGGLVSHIPDSYGGSASDRILVQRSDVIQKCDPKDSIMVDKGFHIQDMAAPYDIKINIPTFVKKINQLPPAKLKQDRKISAKRVHVERLIGLGKTYKILVEPMNEIETILASRIVHVCYMLCNFRPCIVPVHA